MIKEEQRELNGVIYKYTYSDAGCKIMQDGTNRLYDTVYDPVGSGRTYTETDIPIEDDENVEDIVDELRNRW